MPRGAPLYRPYNHKWFLMEVGVAGVGANAGYDAGKAGYSHWKQHKESKSYPTSKTHQFRQ